MSLLRASDPDDQHDVVASNLLFATIGVTVLLIAVSRLPYHDLPMMKRDWLALARAGLFLLLRSLLYYAIRRGLLAAKLLVVISFVVAVYQGTHWQEGYVTVAGVNFTWFSPYSGLVLVHDLLMLAALVLMFTKPRVAARGLGQ